MLTIRTFTRAPDKAPWLAVFFALVAIAGGYGIAWAVKEFGYIALLLIPAIALFVVSILYPKVGLITLIFVTYTQLSNILIKFHNLPSIAQPLAGMLLLVVLIRVFMFGDRAENWHSAAIRLAIYGFVLFLTVLVASNYDPARSKLIDFIKDALIAMIVVFLVQKPAHFKNAVWTIIFAGAIMGTVSAFQHITATYNNTYLGFGGWISEVAGQVSRQRVTGPFSNPNAYAQILVVVVPLALDRLWHERKLFFRILSLWALIACSLSILFTYSRGGFLTLSFAIVLLLIERRPTLLPLVLTAVLGLILMRLLPTTYTERISTLLEFVPSPTTQITDPSFRGRLSENTAGWMMFRDHPILGVGLSNFPTQYQSYSRQLGIDPRSQKRSPASLYVEVLSEQGSLGLIVFASLLWAIHRGLRQAIKHFRDSYEKDLAFLTNAYWVSLAAYLFSAINKNSAYSNIFWMLVGLAFAIANVAFQSYLAERNSQKMETMRQGNSV